MRFLVDAQLPPALAAWLAARGHEAEHVFAMFEKNTPDHVIARASVEIGAVVVSKDNDFLRLQTDGRPPFVWVRIGNSTNQALFARLETEWPHVIEALSRGEAIVEVG